MKPSGLIRAQHKNRPKKKSFLAFVSKEVKGIHYKLMLGNINHDK